MAPLIQNINNVENSAIQVPSGNVVDKHYFDQIGLTVAYIKITPKLAEHWLNFRPERQRVLKNSLIEKLSQDIKAGCWSGANGETIKFDKDGNLIDGQHRLMTVFKTGSEIYSFVVFGCDQKEIETIDAGASRSMADVFKIYGIDNYVRIAAIVSNILCVKKTGAFGSWAPSKKAAVDFAIQNLNELQYASKMTSKTEAYLPDSIAGYLYYMYSRVNKGLTEEMYDEFKKGNGNRCNAVDVLKETMARMNKSMYGTRSSGSRYFVNAITVKAFNAYFLAVDVKLLRYTKQEKYPQIIDTWM